MRNLEKVTVVVSQRDFDRWHEAACTKLQTLYHDHGFTDFSVGQAQKWLNMSLKYVFTLGQDRLQVLRLSINLLIFLSTMFFFNVQKNH